MIRKILSILFMLLPMQVFAIKTLSTGDDFVFEELHKANRFWGITTLPNNDILLTEFKTGNLLLVQIENNQVRTSQITLKLAIENQGQAGLFDIVLHPNFAANNYIYLSYALKTNKGSALAVARGVWQNNQLTNIQILYQTPDESRTQHYGGAMAFDNNNKLYLAAGERNYRQHAQDLKNPFGKILRLNDDGSIPNDNPLASQTNVAKEIYAWGIRNAQGLAYNKNTNTLWQSEQGPQGGDELNIIRSGQNYGWPQVTTGEEYGGGKIGVTTKAGMADPIIQWTPSPAFSSLLLYTYSAIPSLTNKLIIPGLRSEALFIISVNGNTATQTQTLLSNQIGRIRNAQAGANGHVYVIDDAGGLYRMRPK